MNPTEAATFYRYTCEKFHRQPDPTVEAAWVNGLAGDDLGLMAAALASMMRRGHRQMPSIAELRAESRRTYADPSKVRSIARAAYEDECRRLGRSPSSLLTPPDAEPGS